MTTSDLNTTTPAAAPAPAPRIVLLPTGDIRIDGGTQARAEINQATVGEYAEALAGGATFPPVIVFFDGADHWLADGFHRWHAHNTAGKASIEAEVRNGTQRDARLFSFGANADHGLRRGNADKRKAVLAMLEDEEWSAWADRVIARTCAVSHNFVSSLRRHLSSDDRCDAAAGATEAPAAPVARTVQRGGTVYQQKVRQPSAPRGRAQKSMPAAAAPAVPMPADLSAIPVNLTRAEGAQLAHQLREEDQEDFDALAELEKSHAEVVRLQKVIDMLTADDQKAETLKQQIIAHSAGRKRDELLAIVNTKERHLAWQMKIIRRCSKAVDVDDPDKLAPAVEAVVRRLRDLEAAAQARDDGSTTPPVSARAAHDARVPEGHPAPVVHAAPAVVAPARDRATDVPVPRVADPAEAADLHALADGADVFEPEPAQETDACAIDDDVLVL